ncbi:MAG TPA: hypothetical protein VFH56_02830 [Acidimicrobiales bacterium]|nr:hypothetical protein [Acidimicrobiales bacterium]
MEEVHPDEWSHPGDEPFDSTALDAIRAAFDDVRASLSDLSKPLTQILVEFRQVEARCGISSFVIREESEPWD